MNNKKHRHGGFYEFILMALFKEGPLSLKELKEKTLLFVSHFGYYHREKFEKKARGFLDRFRIKRYGVSGADMARWRREYGKQLDVEFECKDLIKKGMIRLNKENKCELTQSGQEQAEKFAKEMETAAHLIERHFLNPAAAARNTIIADFFLAVMKLFVGFISGSVGLIADGADAAIDTVSAVIVWVGIKYKKEFVGTLIIIAMMFITGISVGYESINKIIEALFAIIEPISMPILVIVAEAIALIFAVILSFYQRYIGKKYGSLALISQSVDSKNHIYVAAMVIAGAIFSMFGIYFVDALIGGFVIFRILKDAIELLKEVLSSIKGEKTDFSKYKVPFEKHWHMNRLQTFRIWILYSIKEDGLYTKDELINALEMTFRSGYIPILSEFKFTLGKGFDFREEFNNLIKPLLEQNLLVKKDDTFVLTRDGKKRVEKAFKSIRFHANE